MVFRCMQRRVIALGIFLTVVLGISACEHTHVTPVARLASAAAAGENLAPIQLDRVVFNLERGQLIGSYRDGNFQLCGPSFTPKPIHWTAGKLTARDEELMDAFYREMHAAHYNVVGNPDALFGNFNDSEKAAEFLVGGRIDSIQMDVCDEVSGWDGHRLGTQHGATSVGVTWQIYSTLDRTVVLETRTSGSSELKDGVPDGEIALIIRAFAAAARNLGGDPRFHAALLRKSAGTQETTNNARMADWGAAASFPALPIPAPAPFSGGIGANIARIQASVVTITTGMGQGSGFFVAPDLVLTNHHVARDAERLKVTLINGMAVYARTLRSDPKRDVALLQVEGGPFASLPLRLSQVALAEEVYAVGSPLDESLAGTVTRGIVSQVQRDEFGMELIQADTMTQPGSSGGPLLDAQGNVVALSQSGLLDSTEHSVGINFFVPIADALKKLNIVQQ